MAVHDHQARWFNAVANARAAPPRQPRRRHSALSTRWKAIDALEAGALGRG